jgi:hypothetical protein
MAEASAVETSANEAVPGQGDLGQRVARLEDAVGALCDTQAMEDRLATRIAEQVRAELKSAAAAQAASPGGYTEEAATDAAPTVSATPSRPPARRTFIGDVWNDIVLFLRMLRDPVYAMSWGSVLVSLIAFLYLTVWAWFKDWMHQDIPTIPVISYLDDLVVAYIGFKVLSRELRQYEQFLAERERAQHRPARSEH